MQHVRDTIKPVLLDRNGIFKYIQIRLTLSAGDGSDSYVIVRGSADCAFHADALAKFHIELENQGLSQDIDAECPGGGRVNVNEANKSIQIYGYSQGFGRANHAQSKEIIDGSGQYEGYTVTWSNEGY